MKLPNIKKLWIGVGCVGLTLFVLHLIYNHCSSQNPLNQVDISNATCVKMECREYPSISLIVTVFPLPKQLESEEASLNVIAVDPIPLIQGMLSWFRDDSAFQVGAQEEFQWTYRLIYYTPPSKEETYHSEIEVLVGETYSEVNSIPYLSSEVTRFDGFYQYVQETFAYYKGKI